MIHRISLDEQREAWNRAIERAINNGCEHRISHVCTAKFEGYETTFDVRSASKAGQVYFVQLIVGDSKRESVCDCPAGQNGVICWHAAGAALTAGMVTQPEPVDEVEEAPIDAPQPAKTADFDFAAILSGDYAAALAAGQLG